MKTLSAISCALVIGSFFFAGQAIAQDADAALIAKGQYLSTAGDCGACHSVSGGKPFAGGLAIQTPIGAIYATNITPSKTAGIGDYTLEDFDRAVRQGIRKDGAHLYPGMPYTSFSKITDEDVAALYAYFMHGVDPVDEAASETALPFPFNIRLSMAGWNLIFADGEPFKPDPAQSAAWNRGAYLVQGLTHCSTCHTPRNFLMAEETSKALAGASLGTWFAPNVTPDQHAGIGSWSTEQLAAYLSTGRSGNGSQAGGPMLEAIDKSFSKLTEDDISAIVTYVKRMPALALNAPPGKLPAAAPHVSDVALMSGSASAGAELYDAHCSTCHQASGEGFNGLPALFGNAALRRPVADNAVMAILTGLDPTKGQVMPSFGDRMDDAQVATLVNYLFATFGDAGVQTTPQRVGELRQGGAVSPLILLARIGIAAGAVFLLLLAWVAWLVRRRRTKRGAAA